MLDKLDSRYLLGDTAAPHSEQSALEPTGYPHFGQTPGVSAWTVGHTHIATTLNSHTARSAGPAQSNG
jgi:hypothetical protein